MNAEFQILRTEGEQLKKTVREKEELLQNQKVPYCFVS